MNRFKAKQQLSSRSTLFLHISLPSVNAHDAKMPNFPHYGGRKQATMKFFLFFNLNIQGS